MNYLIKVCERYGILDSEIDYHVLRASMVLIFLFFGYQKWFEYEAQALIPYISNGPLISWDVSSFRIQRCLLVPRRLGMDLWRAPVHRILEQDGRRPWRARRNRFVCVHH